MLESYSRYRLSVGQRRASVPVAQNGQRGMYQERPSLLIWLAGFVVHYLADGDRFRE